MIEALGPPGRRRVGRLSDGGLRGLPARPRPARRSRAHGHLPGPRGSHRRRRDPHPASRSARHLRAARSALRRAGRSLGCGHSWPRPRGRSGSRAAVPAVRCPRRADHAPTHPAPAAAPFPDRAWRRSSDLDATGARRPASRPAAGRAPIRPVRATRRRRTPAHPRPAAAGAVGDRRSRGRAAARVRAAARRVGRSGRGGCGGLRRGQPDLRCAYPVLTTCGNGVVASATSPMS